MSSITGHPHLPVAWHLQDHCSVMSSLRACTVKWKKIRDRGLWEFSRGLRGTSTWKRPITDTWSAIKDRVCVRACCVGQLPVKCEHDHKAKLPMSTKHMFVYILTHPLRWFYRKICWDICLKCRMCAWHIVENQPNRFVMYNNHSQGHLGRLSSG